MRFAVHVVNRLRRWYALHGRMPGRAEFRRLPGWIARQYREHRSRDMNPLEVSAHHWDAQALSGQLSQWTTNPIIEEAVYRKMTGGSRKFWLNWLLDDYFSRSFDRVLSVGCGSGDHEMILARHPKIAHVDAFDLSPQSIRLASEKASAEGLSRKCSFIVSEFGACEQNLPAGHYDLVCFFGSLHHVRELESMLGFVSRRLAPGGRVVFNEYTGDCYTILDERKVGIINGLLGSLDACFLNPSRPRYVNPTLDQMLAGDPSEAVRSALMIPFLRHRFEFELLRPFGGAILHCMYPSLNHAKLADGSPESRSIVELLVEFERVLYEDAKYLPSDFHFGVCRAIRDDTD